ncbi:MAG: hypothetical protein PVF73_03685, partial [Bacteroidales bacterium]
MVGKNYGTYRLVLILVFTLTFFYSKIQAETYYVAPWGNDNSSGTFELPWGTWQKAFEEAKAGDVVY